MHIIKVSGNHSDLGRKLGQTLKKEIRHRLRNLHITDEMVDSYKTQLKRIHSMCAKAYPHQIEALRSMAEHADIDYWKILLLNSPELRLTKDGCSTIVTNGINGIRIFHNEDADKGDRKSDFVLVEFLHKGRKFHFFVYPGELGGTAFNWNSSGLFFTVNYVNSGKSQQGIPRYFTAHAMIYSKSIKECLSIIQRHPDASGFHYYIGFGKTVLSAETYRGSVSLKYIQGMDFHTNHYIHKRFSYFESYNNSDVRLGRIKQLLNEGRYPLNILFDKKNRPDSIYSQAGDVNLTVATVVFDTKNRTISIYDKTPRYPIRRFKLK